MLDGDKGRKSARCDVLVIGGGPAGSTASALLAEKGWHVVVLEKERHPRFHIGESLLPLSLAFFERLGVRDEVEKIGIRKYGGEFNSAHPGKSTTFYFDQALDERYPYAYEVRRSEFDHLLLKNSAAKGAEVHEGVRVTGVEFRGPGKGALVTATDENGNVQGWKTRFIVDGSGRDTLLARQLGTKEKNKRHDSAALFGHFEGAARRSGRDEGNISIYWFEHGWFWMIPLKDGIMSVGAVCWPYYIKSKKTNLEQFFQDTLEMCPGVAERLAGAKLVSKVTGTGNYSYQAKHMAGEGYILVGDAFAFVDPIFSSGVHLAMNSGLLGAETVDACLRNPPAASKLLRRYDKTVRRGLKIFSWFIYRVTTPSLRKLMMEPKNYYQMQRVVTSVLAGDVFRNPAINLPLFLFQGIYYLKNIVYWRQSYCAYKEHKQNVGTVSAAPSVKTE